MLKTLIEKLIRREDLTASEMHGAVEAILNSENREQIAAFLVLLRAKGETAEEVFSMLEVMRQHMRLLKTDFPVLDIVGTGGDQSNSVNISTAASIVAATGGVKVLKHGNRSVSSKCGSADVIEALGVSLSMSPEAITRCLEEVNIAFAFAPSFHPSMKNVMPVRKALGVRTIFNFLGPLLNPASPKYYVMGVYSETLMELFSDVLLKMPIQHAMVVHSCGLDELSLLGASQIIEIKDGKKSVYMIEPESFGLKRCRLSDIEGGDVETNKTLLLSALSGEPGPIADTIALNAGAALYVADQASSMAEGVENAKAILHSGDALKTIDRWVMKHA